MFLFSRWGRCKLLGRDGSISRLCWTVKKGGLVLGWGEKGCKGERTRGSCLVTLVSAPDMLADCKGAAVVRIDELLLLSDGGWRLKVTHFTRKRDGSTTSRDGINKTQPLI